MKIGYINIRSPNPAKGPTGRTIHIQEVCKAWRKMGHEVFVITGNPLSICADVKIYNLSIPTPLSFDRLRRRLITLFSQMHNKIKSKNTTQDYSNSEDKFPIDNSLGDFKKLSWSPRFLYRDIVQIINEYQYDMTIGYFLI